MSQVNIFVGVIKKDSMVDDLMDFLEFDDDATGVNGDEWLSDEAAAAGFECNADYWIDQAQNKEGNFGDQIYCFMEFLSKSWGSYSRSCAYLVFENGVCDDTSYQVIFSAYC